MDTNNFEAIEQDAIDAPVKDIKWYGNTDRTKEESIHDKGKGEPIVIRLFEYKFPPTLEVLPTKEQLLTPEYIKEVHTRLWADGLRIVSEPRTEISKGGCKIFVPCVATVGNSHLEEPKLLQEWI